METILKSKSKAVTIGPDLPLVLIGERINPTGRKKIAQAIEKRDFKLLQQEAINQANEGAHLIDVNVGLSGIDEAEVLREAVYAIMEVTDCPLCIDSALPKALEAALEVYEGKALVNSVNGEEAKLKEVLPMVRSFNAAVIGLTMDDAGIPKEAVKKLEIARKIVEAAEREGVPTEDVVIDPLAMAISTDQSAALQTLEALRLIRNELGVNQTLGISNVSFGLPDRHAINAIFLALAVFNGMTCAIVDPTTWEMRRAGLITDLLLDKDEFCMNYISIYREKFPE